MSSLFIALVFMLAMEGDSHGNHGYLREWFNSLQSDKGPCCSAADGYTVTDADWKSRDGHYQVRVPRSKGDSEMVWVDVPDDAVVRVPNLAGQTIVWPIYALGSPIIRCFMPGSMT
jgi:hypothetical protein